jgi:sodium-coupled monocarboxylate transporter 8/12
MAHLAEHFSLLDYAVFALYLLATVSIGTLFIKGQRNLNEYFLAGRTMGSVIVAMTVLASLFSGISFLAAPSEGYANGPLFFFVNVAFFIATPITAVLFLPVYYNSRFFTAYQYLEERFSVQLRTLASVSFIIRVLLWLAAATYAPALALEQATGMPLWFTILCTGILTTFYTTFGGMRAVIWTDVMQLVVLFGGQLAIAIVAIVRVPGGMSRVIELGAESGRLNLSLSLDPTVRLTLWGLLIGAAFMHLVQMATDQVSVQRYLSASSLAVARRGLWMKLIMTLPVTAVFYGTGLVLYAFYKVHGDPLAAGNITKADQILPYFVVHELPHGLPGLFIAAIYAASMSTISAGINSLTSASLVDFYQRLWRNPNLAEKHQLRIARWLTFVYGGLVIVLAFLVHRLGTLLEATNKVIGLVGGPLVGLFLLGILFTRATARGALIGWIAGLAMTIWVCFGTDISFLWYAMTGCVTTLLVGYAVSRFDPPPDPKQLRGLTWSQRPATVEADSSNEDVLNTT